ncbi:hypothetical protein OK074_4027 [Actinobacteria bacterium OK074]|nr:hypothetical protein OK074_4027 [Actinobacteria bacterium OK074]
MAVQAPENDTGPSSPRPPSTVLPRAPFPVGGAGEPPTAGPGVPPHPGRPHRPLLFRRPSALALVALAYLAAQLALVVPHLAHLLGWDETVYVSQVNARIPAAYFSAPRSRGISFLVAPLLTVTDSPHALRLYLAVLAALALYAAYRTWRPLLGPAVTTVAALLFASLWTTQLYGPQAMPNLWVALAAVAALGWFLRAPTEPYARWWCAACLVVVALMRISDVAWLALPLLLTAVFVRRHRRTLPFLLGGLAAGVAQWVVEAYARWGGIPQRLHASAATEGGMSPHLNFHNAWRSLDGPELCRWSCTAQQHHPALGVWWLSLPVFAAVALVIAVRDKGVGRERVVLPLAAAGALAVPYLLLISYSAPRFLMPAYALLALPIAGLVVRATAGRRWLVAVVSVLVALHVASQFVVVQKVTAEAVRTDRLYRTAARDLRDLGIHGGGCLITGSHALPVAYDAGCASAETDGNNASTTASRVVARAENRQPVVALSSRAEPRPGYARTWTRFHLRGTHWAAWVAPRGE